MELTAEVTVAAVVNDDWTCLREVLDVVHGSLLIEDPDAPVLMMPVTAKSASAAQNFVEGILGLKGIAIVKGRIDRAPADDYELGDADGEGSVSGTVTTSVSFQSIEAADLQDA